MADQLTAHNAEEPATHEMALNRAKAICAAINDRCFFNIGITETVGSLKDLSLAEMLEAKRIVKNKNRSADLENGVRAISLIPDDRLIAAAYTLEHFHADEEESVISVPLGANIKALAVIIIDRPETDSDENEGSSDG